MSKSKTTTKEASTPNPPADDQAPKKPKKSPKKLKDIKNKPMFKQRLIVQSVILLITIILAIVFSEYRGYWALISAAAVLICEDIADIKKRGTLRMIGAFVGFLAGSLIALINLGIVGTIVFLALGIFLVIRFLPTEKYALGSAGIGLIAVAIASLTEGAFSWQLLWERLLWTLIGAAIAIILISLSLKLYTKKSPRD